MIQKNLNGTCELILMDPYLSLLLSIALRMIGGSAEFYEAASGKLPEKAERLLKSGDMHALTGVACLEIGSLEPPSWQDAASG